jgi:integrase
MGCLKDFLNLCWSPNTQKTYRHALKVFFTTIYPSANQDEDQLADRYMRDTRDCKSDILAFLQYISKNPPKTTRSQISCVKTFLIENDVELPDKFWRRVSRRIKGSRARTRDKVPSTAELRNIVMHLPIRGRALTLLLVSSGMRTNEALNLLLTDVDLEAEPIEINIRGEYTKTGNRRTVFASAEARDTVREWLKSREDYLKQSRGRSYKHKKPYHDQRLFPFHYMTFWTM